MRPLAPDSPTRPGDLLPWERCFWRSSTDYYQCSTIFRGAWPDLALAFCDIVGRWAMLGVAGSLAVELLGYGNW